MMRLHADVAIVTVTEKMKSHSREEEAGAPLENQARTVTLKDLAQELGIHPSTVSRVLHADAAGAKGAASSSTAALIRELAQKRGYAPDPQAASLRTGRTHMLGVIVPRLSDIVLALMYEGVEDKAAELGYSTFVMNSRDDPEQQRRKVDLMLARRVDGLIVADAHLDTNLLERLTRQKVPFVLMNRRVPGCPSATCDDTLGGQLVAEHFWNNGHRKVSVIAGEAYASTAQDRTSGFVERWRELGGKIRPGDILNSRFDTAGGHTTTEELLMRSGRKPSAIFAVNDFAAIGAMGALRSHGLTVGKDVAVAGFNDTPLAAQLPIPLTSVRSPTWEIGRAAMELMQGAFAGSEVESVRLTPSLQVRESSE